MLIVITTLLELLFQLSDLALNHSFHIDFFAPLSKLVCTVCYITEIKIQKELQQQKLLSSNLMISIDFVNRLKGTLKT